MLHLPLLRQRRPGEVILGHQLGRVLAHPFSVPPQSRPKHTYIIGRTGQGKSKTLEWICQSDIASGLGCCLIDPHSQLSNDLLRLLLTNGVMTTDFDPSRIMYVDPSRKDFVIPFNVLATPDEPYRVAASVIEAFRRTWPQALSEAPHFSNVMIHSLLLLIKARRTLIDLPRLLVDNEWREVLLETVGNPKLTSFFHDRYDRWGREAPLMRESSLNKVTALSINPYLEVMLGQPDNALDFGAIMDDERVLLLDLGHLDPETNRLIGSLVMTGFELAMRRRKLRTFYSLVIDEFAGYVANEGSAMTLAHVFSEGRKYGLGMTVAHQTLSQLTPRMLGALGNTETKIIFAVDRYDAEYLAKVVGKVNTEAVKRDAKTEAQHEVFSPLAEQWEVLVDQLRYQRPRQVTVSGCGGRTWTRIMTVSVPRYRATEQMVEQLRLSSLQYWGIPFQEASSRLHQVPQSTLHNAMPYDVVSHNAGSTDRQL